MNKSTLYICLFLFLSCFLNKNEYHSKSVDGFLWDVRGNKIGKYDSTSGLSKKIDKILRKNNTHMCYTIYQYWDIYLLSNDWGKGCLYYFYNPKNNSVIDADSQKPYQYYFNKNITSINDTRDLLEHILIIDEFRGVILDSLELFYQISNIERFNNISLDSLKNRIKFSKPTIIKHSDMSKHVFFVYSCPHQGGTIYKYEIDVKNKKLQDKFKIKALFCFGDKWLYE